jgi:hypothetical protein
MGYLDPDRLAALDARAFRSARPYPHVNPAGLLTAGAHARLSATLPDVALFEERFGVPRKHGQASHDRYTLEHEDGLALAEPWRAFLAELRGGAYRAFLRRMLGVRLFDLQYHWHYAPAGCSISPHCDSPRKLGSHIFYFNDPAWRPEWGGQTLVLDDNGRFERRSAPAFDAFEREIASEVCGNQSFLFARRESSWHGMRPLRCPDGHMRRVFIVVINRFWSPATFKRRLGLAKSGY